MATWKTRSMYLLHTATRSCWTSQAINQLDCVSNERIYHLTNTQPLINTARQHQLCFLGHMLGMPEEEPCRKYALYVYSNSRQKEQDGRGQVTYPIYRRIFEDAENDLNQEAIASLAADRCAWRKYVVTCSAAEWMNEWIKMTRKCKFSSKILLLNN